MLKFKDVTIFYLSTLVLSVVATSTSSPSTTPESHTTKVDYGEMEKFQDVEEGYTSFSLYSSEKLQDWSYCNYSSKEWCARSSITKWGGKYYDPLSFKGGENDTYGKNHLSIPHWSSANVAAKAVALHLSTEVA
jgi:hypothetical protein